MLISKECGSVAVLIIGKKSRTDVFQKFYYRIAVLKDSVVGLIAKAFFFGFVYFELRLINPLVLVRSLGLFQRLE